MARKPIISIKPLTFLQHLPFRVVSRILLSFSTIGMLVFVSWMIYRIYFQVPKIEPVVFEQRTELLQSERIELLEEYEKNLEVPPFPASIFPTTDNSSIP